MDELILESVIEHYHTDKTRKSLNQKYLLKGFLSLRCVLNFDLHI